jgi:hypothetical protein
MYVLLTSASLHICSASAGDFFQPYLENATERLQATKQNIQEQTDHLKEKASAFYTASQNKTGFNAHNGVKAWDSGKKAPLFSIIGALTGFGIKSFFDTNTPRVMQYMLKNLKQAPQNGIAHTLKAFGSSARYFATKHTAKAALTSATIFGLASMMYHASEWNAIDSMKNIALSLFNRFFGAADTDNESGEENQASKDEKQDTEVQSSETSSTPEESSSSAEDTQENDKPETQTDHQEEAASSDDGAGAFSTEAF